MAVHLQHHAAIGSQHLCAIAGLDTGAGIGAQKRDRLPHRLLDQRAGRQQVIIEILFDNPDAGARQHHRFRADFGRDIRQFLTAAPGGEPQLPPVLHQRLAVLIDGECHIALRAARCGLVGGRRRVRGGLR